MIEPLSYKCLKRNCVMVFGMIILFLLDQCCLSSQLDYVNQQWGGICDTGKSQSPIDFPNKNSTNIKKTLDVIRITSNDYKKISGVAPQIYHEYKYMIDLTNIGKLYVTKNGIKYAYSIADMHFHFYSEHTFQGVSSDIEMHLVHKKDTNYTLTANLALKSDPEESMTYLVVGILFKASGSVNNALVDKMNIKSKANLTLFDLSSFVSTRKSFYHYSGGLTTPGCDEIVNWIVMEKFETISLSQFDEFKEWIGEEYKSGNARKTYGLNGRTIYYVPLSGDIHRITFLIFLFFVLILL